MLTWCDRMPYAAVIMFMLYADQYISKRFNFPLPSCYWWAVHNSETSLCTAVHHVIMLNFNTFLVTALSVYGSLIIALFIVYREWQVFFVMAVKNTKEADIWPKATWSADGLESTVKGELCMQAGGVILTALGLWCSNNTLKGQNKVWDFESMWLKVLAV